ncbi:MULTISPECIES: hypothetical protein [Aeromonas]|uniref:hypothetical protein n=1 Tax=Aeromonas TaxID=642 RepID=UPI000F767BAF|nr:MULTISPECIES: hypothetical protein [Aeromonas]MDX7595486.1 hypothetical protein [Aeromonas caviae]RSM25321.1 hypothetical protein C5B78_14510 [Aeromonas salmonicida]GJA12736.1 hypothetical protein KAM334_40470 [Aeromonas caviae]
MKQPTQKTVTVRFSMQDYINLVNEAEANNTTTAEVIRQAWASHQEHRNLTLMLSNLERNILSKNFEICSATVGLSEMERKKAARQVNVALGKELIQ